MPIPRPPRSSRGWSTPLRGSWPLAFARSSSRLVKNRRDATTLAGLDDRMLADIGLTRGDVRDAFSEPVWRDPTAILVSRAHERRINRRRVGLGLAEKAFDAPSIVPLARRFDRARRRRSVTTDRAIPEKREPVFG